MTTLTDRPAVVIVRDRQLVAAAAIRADRAEARTRVLQAHLDDTRDAYEEAMTAFLTLARVLAATDPHTYPRSSRKQAETDAIALAKRHGVEVRRGRRPGTDNTDGEA